jgi:hypothetical protein
VSPLAQQLHALQRSKTRALPCCSIGSVIACILNLLLPSEKAMLVPQRSMYEPQSGEVSKEPTVHYRNDDPPIDEPPKV